MSAPIRSLVTVAAAAAFCLSAPAHSAPTPRSTTTDPTVTTKKSAKRSQTRGKVGRRGGGRKAVQGPRAPAPLTKKQRLDRVSKLVKGSTSKALTELPPDKWTHLTPLHPIGANARIKAASRINFWSEMEDAPGGMYGLTNVADGGGVSSMLITMNTEAGKLYVVDCRLITAGNTQLVDSTLTISTPAGESPVTGVNGHLLAVFAAGSTSSEVRLVFEDLRTCIFPQPASTRSDPAARRDPIRTGGGWNRR
jgi:hypothetical protein